MVKSRLNVKLQKSSGGSRDSVSFELSFKGKERQVHAIVFPETKLTALEP